MGACDVMIIVVENGHSDSRWILDSAVQITYSASTFGCESNYISSSYGFIVGQNGLFNLSMDNWIQTC